MTDELQIKILEVIDENIADLEGRAGDDADKPYCHFALDVLHRVSQEIGLVMLEHGEDEPEPLDAEYET